MIQQVVKAKEVQLGDHLRFFTTPPWQWARVTGIHERTQDNGTKSVGFEHISKAGSSTWIIKHPDEAVEIRRVSGA